MKAKKKRSTLMRKQNRAGYLFILPWVLGFLFFFLKPLMQSLWFAFNETTMGAEGIETTFVGLGNFRFLLFEDSTFLTKLMTTLGNILLQVVICASLSLFIAVVLVQNFRGRTIYRAIYFLPIIMTSGVVYTLVSGVVGSAGISGTGNAYMFTGTSIAQLMVQGGVPLSVVNLLLAAVDSIFNMIVNCGVPILLYISALQKIPASTYEAARIAGANAWDIFWKVTVPKIAPIIFLNIVYIIVDASTAYGSDTAGNTMMYAIQNMGFGKTMKFGMSAAMAWLYFLVIALFLLLAWLLLGRRANRIEN